MQLPLQITYRDIVKTDSLESEIRSRASRLDRFHERIMSCRMALEKPHRRDETETGWRVRLDITLPHRRELVVQKESLRGGGDHAAILDLVRAAFDAAKRQLKREAEVERGQVKVHPAEEADGFVEKLFEDHGFLRKPGSTEGIYFHRNSLAGFDFDQLRVGMPVAFSESGEGVKGIQASTVRVPTGIGPKPRHR